MKGNDDAESSTYQVLILYRPTEALACTQVQCRAEADEAVQLVDDGLQSAGIDTQILLVGEDIESVLAGYDPRQTVIFNYCDGYHADESGYDPITQLYERLNLAYTGADDQTLFQAQSKAFTKAQLVKNGVSTPTYRVFDSDDVDGWDVFPALVKPTRMHASLGIYPDSVAEDRQQLRHHVQRMLDEYQQAALVEDFLDGAEYRVSVWGNGRLEVLPFIGYEYLPIEGRSYSFKDYQTKWDETNLVVNIPAQVSSELAVQIEALARSAFQAVGMRDYGGIDIRLKGEMAYVIDPNQNPDISTDSSFYRAVRAAGGDYSALVTRIVQLAAARRP